MAYNKEIYFIRHGETNANLERRGQNSESVLTPNGKKQATITGKYLKDYRLDKKFDVVYCSPFIRARETAEIICKKIGYNVDNIIYDKDLVEQDKGQLADNKTNDERKKDKKYNYMFKVDQKLGKIKDPIEGSKMRLLNKDYLNFEKHYDMESLLLLRKRLNRFINKVKKSKYKKILIITHNGVITRGIIPLLCNIENICGNYQYGSNCHISYFTFSRKSANSKYIIKLWAPPNTYHFGLYK